VKLTTLKAKVAKTLAYRLFNDIRLGRTYTRLRDLGHLAPMPYKFKRLTIRLYAQYYGLNTLVETGTYHGDTIAELKDSFHSLYSIELQPDFYRKASQRFAGDSHVRIVHGDSGMVLGDILAELDEPCLFWLDGHYSYGQTARGTLDTPIEAELAHLFAHAATEHVVLIDDAREFTGRFDYPSIKKLRELVTMKWPAHRFDVCHDIIRISPRTTLHTGGTVPIGL
jgi:hypothetical protein